MSILNVEHAFAMAIQDVIWDRDRTIAELEKRLSFNKNICHTMKNIYNAFLLLFPSQMRFDHFKCNNNLLLTFGSP